MSFAGMSGLTTFSLTADVAESVLMAVGGIFGDQTGRYQRMSRMTRAAQQQVDGFTGAFALAGFAIDPGCNRYSSGN